MKHLKRISSKWKKHFLLLSVNSWLFIDLYGRGFG